MSVRHLKALFRPSAVAVLDASSQPGSPGAVAMRNLLQGGFKGPIMPVSAGERAVHGVLAYPSIDALPEVPDLAVACGPTAALPAQAEALAARGTRALLIAGPVSADSAAALRAVSQRHGLRILGGNTLGAMVPSIGLNASLAAQPANPGRIAFVSQSRALCAAVLDWARPKGIGFSHFISLGDGMDVDFGDLLDYLGSDAETRAILLYIESIRERRDFMSAARAAARNKPVLAIKAGRRSAGAQAALSHSGALAGADLVYDAAFRRAGMLRVYEVEELFAAAETLGVATRPRGERLAILTNGGGIAVMAADDLADLGGRLATFSDETLAKLDQVLKGDWSRGNPVDIGSDAGPGRTAEALAVLAQAREVDAVLVLHTPMAAAGVVDTAEKVIEVAGKNRRCSLYACWMGAELAGPARRLFHAAGIPVFETPAQAVQAFMHTVHYRRNQDLLMETPASLPSEFTPNTAAARMVIETARGQGRTVLSEPESKALLAAYGIPTVETHIARSPADCRAIAAEMGGTVAVKILSPDITHKSDRGGVRLNIESPEEAEAAAGQIAARMARHYPDARLEGFTVQRMERRPGAVELFVGVSTDPIFGPVILFGQGGVAVEVIGDRAIGLPPLNMMLARELIERTRVARLLAGFRGTAAADHEALCLTLIQVAQMVVDLPDIAELDINPLFADDKGVVALDARIALTAVPATGPGPERLAIRPYPRELEETFVMKTGRAVLLRPIRPEDEPNHHVFVSRLTPEDIRFRFFGLVQELPHSQMARLTQIDYDREMAFIATGSDSAGTPETLGVVRAVNDPDNETTEFSIVVRSDLKGSGLAKALMIKIINYCRARGTRVMVGQVLTDNHRMLSFIESLGFRRVKLIDGDVVEVELDLQGALPF